MIISSKGILKFLVWGPDFNISKVNRIGKIFYNGNLKIEKKIGWNYLRYFFPYIQILCLAKLDNQGNKSTGGVLVMARGP